MISNSIREAIWALHENEHLSNVVIARRVGVARNTVIQTLKQKKYRNEQLLSTMKEINRESNESLLKMLSNDNRLPSIVSQILDIMNSPEQLEKEIKRNGLRPLATVLGILSDKALKTRELEIRIEQPDEAVNVNIYNDAPKHIDEKVIEDVKDIS